jgi:transposase
VRGKPASPVLRGGRRSNAPPLPDRTIRPVKVQQRASGGCWRTLQGLAEFAVVQSYLSTATKWDVLKIDALRGLFSGNPWMPPGVKPALTG